MTLVGGIENIQASSGGTVTNSGGPLALNAVVLGAGGNDIKTVPGFTTDGTANLSVGATAVGGTLTIFGSASGSGTLTAPGNGTQLNLSQSVLNVGPTVGTVQSGNGILTLRTLISGAIQLSPVAGNNTLVTAGNFGFSGGKGQHFLTQASNNDVAGTFTVSASTTGSVTFTTNYTATPVVVLTPQTTGLTSWFLSAVSNSGFTVTVAPSGTYTFGYHVIGNPN